LWKRAFSIISGLGKADLLRTGMSSSLRIGFLGAGKMASALAKGFIGAKLTAASEIIASDVYEEARACFAKSTQARTVAANAEVLKEADVIVIAVKPDQVQGVLEELRGDVRPQHLFVSIAAGVSTQTLEKSLPAGTRVVRVMPNTPALVGLSATGFCLGSAATKEDAATTQRLFSAVGIAFQMKESLLDAVTGLSGSGPAYAYLMIEALSDGGVAAGLPRDAATRLAAQTLLGAAKMVLETGQHPGALKDMVTSPGGTTIEGLHELEKAGVRGALMNAVRAAAEKSKKLGQR
jgi:pyrroline-5-carboxylate reductase